MKTQYLKNSIVLVTGGTGFVGSHLVEALVSGGARVVVTYRASDPSGYFYCRKLDKKVILAYCDLADYDRVLNIITRYEIDTICHLGATAIVETAYKNPREAIVTNIIGTTNVLEAARLTGTVKRIIVASSDKAYGKSPKEYVETMPLHGDHPYEVSKGAADLVAQAYWKTYRLPVIITRFGNIYGPGDINFNRIIPGIIQSILTKEKLKIRSDGTFVRDYVYVGDVVSAYLFLLEHFDRAAGQAFNLASKDMYSVIQLIKKVSKILRKRVRYDIINNQKNEIPYQHLSFEKIKKLGWKPKFPLQKGIPSTYTWYKKNRQIFG